MRRYRRETFAILTDASGDFSFTTQIFYGTISLVRYVPDGTAPLATGADLSITGAETGTVVLVAADIGTSAVTWAPRTAAHLASDGTALLFAAAGEAVTAPVAVVDESLTVTIAQGGDTKAGTLYIVYEDNA